jgi:methane monooxygenase component C
MKLHEIEIVTQCGESIYIECASNEDIITAGLRQDIILMSSCREGGCATCKGLCTDGDYDLVKCTVQALPPEEEEEGHVLLCRAFPKSNMRVEVPYTADRISTIATESKRDFFAELVKITPVASNTVEVTMQRIPDELSGSDVNVSFEPGQFFDIQLPGTDLWRSFSPSNLPNKDGILEFLIRILPDGRFSNFLSNEAKTGQVLNLRGSSGSFYLHDNGLQARYFLAGGTGLSPVLSMVRKMFDQGDPQETRLYFGVSKQEEVFYVNELKALSEKMRNLTVKVSISHPDIDWIGEHGNVVETLRKDLELSGAKPDIYLCGPSGMVDATYRMCVDLDIPKSNICTEKFLPSGSAGE